MKLTFALLSVSGRRVHVDLFLVPGSPPPRCLADIPDSVSSLCLRLLSGQLGLTQHDPRSAALLLSASSVCIYSMCVCVCGCEISIYAHI